MTLEEKKELVRTHPARRCRYWIEIPGDRLLTTTDMEDISAHVSSLLGRPATTISRDPVRT